MEELLSSARRTGEVQRSVPALGAQARHTAITEGTDAALPVFYKALSETTTERLTGSHWMFSPDLARALADEERTADLEQWADAVRQLTHNDTNNHNRAAGALCGAYLAAARGDPGAPVLFESAQTLYRAMPCPARGVEALIGLAKANRRVDKVEAGTAAAQEALRVSEQIGASALYAQAQEVAARANVPTVLATVLFTDIVASTERASELGDRRWRELLDAHDFAVRRQVQRFGGREVKTTGDGVLVVFDAPGRAIRCACAVREAVRALGVEVRAGLHTGEVEERGDDVAGVAVHIAARVLAASGPGEVLVSGAVPPLVAGSGIEFDDRGEHELRGVPGRWRLLEVRT